MNMHSPVVADMWSHWETAGPDGQRQLDMLVPGVHCAGCIARIEQGLMALPGVHQARVSFSTRRLRVLWRGAETSAQTLIATLEQIGYAPEPFAPAAVEDAQSRDSRALLRAMAVAGFAAMNIMLLSVSIWSGAQGATRDLFHAISALIAIPTIAYAGRPFFRSAVRVLRHGRTNMDVPISIGVLLAVLMSLYETLTGAAHAYFDGAVMLLFFLLVGRYLDSVMRLRARDAVAQLMKQMPAGAVVRHKDGSSQWRNRDELAPRMEIIIPAGSRVAVDCVVLEGQSQIDPALVTGESVPELVKVGTPLLAGMLNLDAPLVARVTAVGADSFLSQLVQMMENAEQVRSRYVRIADRAARLYAPAVHSLAFVTAAAWLALGFGWHAALTAAAAVLIITCPCALGLAVPAVQVRAAAVLMRKGILVKDGSALERMAEVDCVFLDKTGTLTRGTPTLVAGQKIEAEDAPLLLALAERSTHPLARALSTYLRAQDVARAQIEEISEVAGHGITGQWQGQELRLGRAPWVGAQEVAAPDTHSFLSLVWRKGDGPAQSLYFADDLRPDAAQAVVQLRALGLKTVILSGDRASAAAPVAQALQIETWYAACVPAEKLAHIEAARAAGAKPLVVGDGLNDGPALAAGHASMAPSSASDVGQAAADMVFLGESLAAVPVAVALARAAQRHVRQNFIMAIGYNILAVPIAMVGLATPLIAAIAMSTSSLLVIGNALRLRVGKLDG